MSDKETNKKYNKNITRNKYNKININLIASFMLFIINVMIFYCTVIITLFTLFKSNTNFSIAYYLIFADPVTLF